MEVSISNCRRSAGFEFLCPRRWDDLQYSLVGSIRHCTDCDKHVYLCRDESEIKLHATVGHCVAVPAALLDSIGPPKPSPEPVKDPTSKATDNELPFVGVWRRG